MKAFPAACGADGACACCVAIESFMRSRASELQFPVGQQGPHILARWGEHAGLETHVIGTVIRMIKTRPVRWHLSEDATWRRAADEAATLAEARKRRCEDLEAKLEEEKRHRADAEARIAATSYERDRALRRARGVGSLGLSPELLLRCLGLCDPRMLASAAAASREIWDATVGNEWQLWKPLALQRFPIIQTILPSLPGEPSFRRLYRQHLMVNHPPEPAPVEPAHQLSSYIYSFEMHLYNPADGTELPFAFRGTPRSFAEQTCIIDAMLPGDLMYILRDLNSWTPSLKVVVTDSSTHASVILYSGYLQTEVESDDGTFHFSFANVTQIRGDLEWLADGEVDEMPYPAAAAELDPGLTTLSLGLFWVLRDRPEAMSIRHAALLLERSVRFAPY